MTICLDFYCFETKLSVIQKQWPRLFKNDSLIYYSKQGMDFRAGHEFQELAARPCLLVRQVQSLGNLGTEGVANCFC